MLTLLLALTLAQDDVLELAGVKGGFAVHLGCGERPLVLGEGFQVHALDRDPAKVEKARAAVRAKGPYGAVSVERLAGDRLPYIDGLVNLVVAEDLSGVAMEEVLRALAPRGVALVRKDGAWTKTVKPVPPTIDDWTHYLHDAGGNPVANDTEIGPPRHLQWLGSPRWSRHHDRMASMSAMVSERGRLFYIMDEGSRVSILLPPKWKLIARDAFNGVILWSRDIPDWQSHLWPLKSGPTQLTRRLVAVDGRVYIPLGFTAPLTALDAATGATVRTYEGTRSTEELVVEGGTIVALVNPGASELADYAPQQSVGDQKRVATEFTWNRKPRRIVALDAASGRELWSKEHVVAPLSMQADAKRVYFHDGERATALDRADGRQAWAEDSGKRGATAFHQGVRLMVLGDVVLCKGTDGSLRSFDAPSGKVLWTAPAPPGGYQSPEDLLAVGGLVWSAPTTSTKDSGVFTGRDPRTGEVKIEFPPDEKTYWFHHRCYIAKGAGKFLLTSRTGVEFVDPTAKDWTIHHWVRGGCLYGVLPANGFVYAPPHDCACYPEAKLFGMNAMAGTNASRALPREIPEEGRHEKGAAFDAPLEATPAGWPTYRGDAARSGYTKEPVPAALGPAWEAKLGGRLSPPTAGDGRLFVARVDENEVVALDAATGRTLWSFTAGARVDSPPTLWKGRALFGSMDGWVYCLRVSDGALAWRYRAAPLDRRHMALERLESVWPVHGSVLVDRDVVHAVAGRSIFLDGGLRYVRLDAATGRRLSETVLDDKDPETGRNLQDRLKILQMPVGLNDILSSDGRQVFLRSQKFSPDGERLGIGPVSGDAVENVAEQKGSDAHVFAPFGFLDDSWFHRSTWVFGRSFSGGHNGFFQAAKVAPAGEILVHDGESVYGYGRKPQYLKWTTPMERQLFAARKEADVVKGKGGPQAKAPVPLHPKFTWTRDFPAYARAMTLAGKTLLVAGPPDFIDEEEAFKALGRKDEDTKKRLVEQDAAMTGARGAKLYAVSTSDGQTAAEIPLAAPPVWDGMAVADGRVYVATIDGRVIALKGR
ncbi:MAG TPA: PQQ-binding-like beta-propeller repeat protein [Planctomycetota bacterium]